MLGRMDAEIEQVYAEAGFTGVRARFILPLVRLARLGPVSIKALAEECGVTHSAMSQTVAAMRTAGLVESVPDPADGRARLVSVSVAAAPVVALG
jgi:DNA-binding MarR family transcriptional regulator